MCSVNVDIDDDSNSLMQAAELIRCPSLCRKCKEVKPVVVLQSKFPYCEKCFVEVVSHKFFGCLGKSKTMRASDRVLLLCSGSQSSSVLLNLIKIGLNERQKKILSEAFVLFIDPGNFIPLSSSERINLVKEMQEMVSQFGFKSYYSPLLFSKNCLKEMNDLDWCTLEFFDSVSCDDLVKSLKTSTAKEDLLIKMRTAVAVEVARELSCNKIFSAETNDHTAANILTNVALGRGDQLPLDIGFSDNRFEDVLILRPLRECSRKEVAFYRHSFNLPFIIYPKGGSLKRKDDSIQKLTEKFVAELQVSFPSTVCMVVGTGNKLTVKQGSDLNRNMCSLCKGKFKLFNKDELSATSATLVSHLISTAGSGGLDSSNFTRLKKIENAMKCNDNSCGKACSCSEAGNPVTFDKVRDAFCYGCQLILKDMSTIEHLPSEILKEANQKIRLEAMREEISDYLL